MDHICTQRGSVDTIFTTNSSFFSFMKYNLSTFNPASLASFLDSTWGSGGSRGIISSSFPSSGSMSSVGSSRSFSFVSSALAARLLLPIFEQVLLIFNQPASVHNFFLSFVQDLVYVCSRPVQHCERSDPSGMYLSCYPFRNVVIPDQDLISFLKGHILGAP